MLVMSIPTNITFTGNQTLISFHVSGSVDINPITLNIDTIITEIKFCIQQKCHEQVKYQKLFFRSFFINNSKQILHKVNFIMQKHGNLI